MLSNFHRYAHTHFIVGHTPLLLPPPSFQPSFCIIRSVLQTLKIIKFVLPCHFYSDLNNSIEKNDDFFLSFRVPNLFASHTSLSSLYPFFSLRIFLHNFMPLCIIVFHFSICAIEKSSKRYLFFFLSFLFSLLGLHEANQSYSP